MPVPCALDDETSALLKSVLKLEPFYPRLSAADVRRLFPKSGLYDFRAREYVIKQGTKAQNVYIIRSGGVRVFRSEGPKTVPLAELGPGRMFGEIALLKPDGVRTASVMAAEPSRIFHLIGDDVRRVMKANSDVGEHLMSLARARVTQQRMAFGPDESS